MASEVALRAIAPYAAHVESPAGVADDLEIYLGLLEKWQRVQNLVSRETLPEFWNRHVADSLQVLRLIGPEDLHFIDLGSGGGFPAIPLAIARKREDAIRFLLIEPNQRKASFLRTVSRELGLRVEVRVCRAEQIDSRETFVPDIITSRAVAALPALCGMAAPFLRGKTRALLHKGREYGEELADSRALWHFDVVVIPSDTSADSVILDIRNLRARTTA